VRNNVGNVLDWFQRRRQFELPAGWQSGFNQTNWVILQSGILRYVCLLTTGQ